MNRIKYWLPFVLMALKVLSISSQASADEQLSERLNQLAKRVFEVTKGEPIKVGFISHVDRPDSNSGLGLEEELRSALKGVIAGGVADDAKFEIKGEYFFAQPEGSDLKQVRIDFRIRNRIAGGTLDSGDLFVNLDSTKTIARILQPTARLEPDATKPEGTKLERNKQLQKADDPKTRSIFVDGSRVASTPDSPFSIEVFAKGANSQDKSTAVMAEEKEGQAFVALQQGQVYEIKITNRSSQPVAAAVFIDGLSDFHFAEGRKPTHWIVHPKGYKEVIDGITYEYDGTLLSQGWFRRPEGENNVDSFLVVEGGKGAISKAGLKEHGKVGVIHVQFSRCKPLPVGSGARAGFETGFGPPKTVATKPVNFEIEVPHDFVSVRYLRELDATR